MRCSWKLILLELSSDYVHEFCNNIALSPTSVRCWKIQSNTTLPCPLILHELLIWTPLVQIFDSASLYIKRGKVSVRPYVRMSVTVGVASSVANDVTITIAGLWRYGDWRHVATGCTALVYDNDSTTITMIMMLLTTVMAKSMILEDNWLRLDANLRAVVSIFLQRVISLRRCSI